MNKYIFIAISVILILGCNFDRERQYNIRYPATLVLENLSREKIDIRRLYSSPDAKSAFVLNGKSILPGKTASIRISEPTYDDILNKHYVLEGSCSDGNAWSKDGAGMRHQSVENEAQWRVVIFIENCGADP
jgi:hypothetical protein